MSGCGWVVCCGVVCVCVCPLVNPLQSHIYLRFLSWQPISTGNSGKLLLDSVGWHKRLVITLAIKVRQLLHPLRLATWVINLACLG